MRSILSLMLVMLIACTGIQAQEYRTGTRKACAAYKHSNKSRSARHATFLPQAGKLIPWQGNTPRRRARRAARRRNRSIR